MGGEIIEELFYFCQRVDCGLYLLGRDGTDCGEDSAVNRSTVEEELPRNLLYEFLSTTLTGGASTLVVAYCVHAPYI